MRKGVKEIVSQIMYIFNNVQQQNIERDKQNSEKLKNHPDFNKDSGLKIKLYNKWSNSLFYKSVPSDNFNKNLLKNCVNPTGFGNEYKEYKYCIKKKNETDYNNVNKDNMGSIDYLGINDGYDLAVDFQVGWEHSAIGPEYSAKFTSEKAYKGGKKTYKKKKNKRKTTKKRSKRNSRKRN